MNFSQISKAFAEVSQISSTNEKIAWLKSHDDPDFKAVLKWYLDPSVITGIAEKKFDKVGAAQPEMVTQDQKDFYNVMRYIESNHTGKDEDVAWIKYLGMNICSGIDEMATFRALVCKNFPMGLQEGIVNKAFPGLIPTFDVMLANSYTKLNEKQVAKIFEKGTREFNVTTKMDGFRCVIIKENGNVKLVSRQGKLYEGCVDIEKAVKELPQDNFVMDSEIIISNRKQVPSTLQYKATSNIVTLKDQEKHGVTCNVFDILTIEEWNNKECVTPYSQRRLGLEAILNEYADNDNGPLYLVPLLYVGTDINEALKLHTAAKANEEEGVMIRFSDSMYEFKRSNDLLKLKVFADMDVYIRGYEEGTNANKGRLGAFICDVEHPEFGHLEMHVGGGYSEKERIEYWEHKDELIGRVMEITYFEVTESKSTGVKSVRFPVHKCIKPEGREPNN